MDNQIITDSLKDQASGLQSYKKPILSCRDLIKIFPRKERHVHVAPLQGLDLDLYPSEIIGIFGPSGSGKTTLLRIMAGLEVPTSGSVMYQDIVVNDLPPSQRQDWYRKNVGLLFQHFRQMLFFNLTVEENLQLKIRLHHLSLEQVEERMESLLQIFKLDAREKQRVKTLSGGEMQRLALIMVLLNEPRILLIDEPTSELDFDNSILTMKMLKQYLSTHPGSTVVISTHDPLLTPYFVKTYTLTKGRLVIMRKNNVTS